MPVHLEASAMFCSYRWTIDDNKWRRLFDICWWDKEIKIIKERTSFEEFIFVNAPYLVHICKCIFWAAFVNVLGHVNSQMAMGSG